MNAKGDRRLAALEQRFNALPPSQIHVIRTIINPDRQVEARNPEIPIAIQDRSFNADGSLFYPDTREFFDGIVHDYIPNGEFSPIWNPEFFGNTLIANGNTWPFARFLILNFNQIPGVEVWMIGNEGGFLAAPVNLTAENGNRLLMAPAERADVIVDFSNVPVGSHVLANVGPDEPFGGGVPGQDFAIADARTTGQVMQFRVVPAGAADGSTPPRVLQLPAIPPLPVATFTRQLALIEEASEGANEEGEEVEGPIEALLGTVLSGVWTERKWMDPVTENPAVGATEVWEIYNTTADAHPMHIHEIAFEVVNREGLVLNADDEVVEPIQLDGEITLPAPWETGFKDTVIAYPGQVTRLKARFDPSEDAVSIQASFAIRAPFERSGIAPAVLKFLATLPLSPTIPRCFSSVTV